MRVHTADHIYKTRTAGTPEENIAALNDLLIFRIHPNDDYYSRKVPECLDIHKMVIVTYRKEIELVDPWLEVFYRYDGDLSVSPVEQIKNNFIIIKADHAFNSAEGLPLTYTNKDFEDFCEDFERAIADGSIYVQFSRVHTNVIAWINTHVTPIYLGAASPGDRRAIQTMLDLDQADIEKTEDFFDA